MVHSRRDQIKQTVTILLALAGIGIMVFYTYCDAACAYVKGDLLGVDLKYIGIFYMAVIALLSGTRNTPAARMLLAAGLGGEIFLLWFQIKENIFCPYCLSFAACVAAAYAVNYEVPKMTGWKKLFYIPGEVRFAPAAKRYPLILFMLAGYAFMALTFSGSTLPVYAAESGPPVYGCGEKEIRVYTDYFCSPCRRAESRMEKLLMDIVKKRKGRILFIDTPIHKETILYAKYFICILGANPNADIREVLKFRRALFEAGGKEIKTEDELREFLKAREIPFAALDARPYFKSYTEYIKEDRISATPTVVVVTREGKTAFGGADNIVKALEKIRGKIPSRKNRP
jgi:protein-disulfide isomerase